MVREEIEIMNSYNIRIKIVEDGLVGKIKFRGNTYKILSDEFTELSIPYTETQVSVKVLEKESEETKAGWGFDIKSKSDIFWMILSLTANGYFEFEQNEPLQIIKKVLKK